MAQRMNEGYKTWGALKSQLSNGGLGTNAKSVYMHEVVNCTNCVVRSRYMGSNAKKWFLIC